jgi:hypothetical protein
MSIKFILPNTPTNEFRGTTFRSKMELFGVSVTDKNV